MSFFSSLKDKFSKKKDADVYLSGFSKTNQKFGSKLKEFFIGSTQINEDFYEELMVTLLESDVGITTAKNLIAKLQKKINFMMITEANDAIELLVEEMAALFEPLDSSNELNEEGLNVILIVGVNGSGKTTSVAKLAKFYKDQGKSVVVAAADTFRAGAITQLQEWARRLDVVCVAGKPEADPSSVVVDACRYAIEQHCDILLVDTAGRLQTKVNLMNELSKMNRVIVRETGVNPKKVWLVLDGTTGQNALSQAKSFTEAVNVNGIICTKMDGTAKGGILLAIADTLKLPVVFVGLGEKAEDLRPFDTDSYLYSITQGNSYAE